MCASCVPLLEAVLTAKVSPPAEAPPAAALPYLPAVSLDLSCFLPPAPPPPTVPPPRPAVILATFEAAADAVELFVPRRPGLCTEDPRLGLLFDRDDTPLPAGPLFPPTTPLPPPGVEVERAAAAALVNEGADDAAALDPGVLGAVTSATASASSFVEVVVFVLVAVEDSLEEVVVESLGRGGARNSSSASRKRSKGTLF